MADGNREHSMILNIDCHLTLRRMQENVKSFIFRIPNMLKMQNKWVYTPRAFSFGPWYFHEQHLMMATKHFKEMLFEGLIQCSVKGQHVNVKVDMSANEHQLEGAISAVKEKLKNALLDQKGELEEAIKAVGSKARECYEGDTNLTQEEFVKLLVLGGCFIIELFREGAGPAGKVPIQESEYILFSSGMILTIYHDIFLLENQIPWFVLELLFDKTKGPKSKMTLVELAIGFIHSAFLLDGHQHQYPILKELLDSGSRILYIIDLLGRYLGSSKEKGIKRPELKSRIHSIPCATRLREARVKFDAVTSRNILDVRFNKKKGALEIPSLVIHPTTVTILRNLISFEQCNPWLWRPWAPSNVICYTMLLDTLVASTEDVDLLCGSGIFGNWLNHKEAVDLLNRLRSGSHMDTFYYADLCKEVNRYCKRLSPKWRVSLIDYYFMKPWAVVSVIVAIIVLLFTIMQLDL